VTGSVLFWLSVAVALFWALGAYNRLVRLRAQVNTAFAVVDSRMTQALVLMGEAGALSQAPSPDVPAAPPGAVPTNQRSGLQGAAIQFEVALRVARKQPLDAAAVAALQTAFATTQPAWERWAAASTETPEATLASVQRAWEDNAVTVRDTVTGFNDAVLAYNAAIAQFPASLLAYFFGFSAAACL
jgi:LemA protein